MDRQVARGLVAADRNSGPCGLLGPRLRLVRSGYWLHRSAEGGAGADVGRLDGRSVVDQMGIAGKTDDAGFSGRVFPLDPSRHVTAYFVWVAQKPAGPLVLLCRLDFSWYNSPLHFAFWFD